MITTGATSVPSAQQLPNVGLNSSHVPVTQKGCFDDAGRRHRPGWTQSFSLFAGRSVGCESSWWRTEPDDVRAELQRKYGASGGSMDEAFEFAIGLDPGGGETRCHESAAPHVHGFQVRNHEFRFSELLQLPGAYKYHGVVRASKLGPVTMIGIIVISWVHHGWGRPCDEQNRKGRRLHELAGCVFGMTCTFLRFLALQAI